MKKLLCVISVILIFLTFLSTNVFAVQAPTWSKYMSKTMDEKKTENGESYYSFGGITQNYSSPGLDFGKLIAEKKDSESITIEISFDARINYIDDDDPIEINMDTIIRGEGFTSALEDKSAFADLYEGSFFKLINNSNIMAYGFNGHKITLTDQWESYNYTLELYNEDLGIGLFEKWFLCFQNYSDFQYIEALEFKNTVITVTGKGEAPAKTGTPAATKAPEETKVPLKTEVPKKTESPITNDKIEDARPIITKDPTKTIAPDSAVSSILANSCSCNNILPIIAIIISSLALLASICAIILVIRKK